MGLLLMKTEIIKGGWNETDEEDRVQFEPLELGVSIFMNLNQSIGKGWGGKCLSSDAKSGLEKRNGILNFFINMCS